MLKYNKYIVIKEDFLITDDLKVGDVIDIGIMVSYISSGKIFDSHVDARKNGKGVRERIVSYIINGSSWSKQILDEYFMSMCESRNNHIESILGEENINK